MPFLSPAERRVIDHLSLDNPLTLEDLSYRVGMDPWLLTGATVALALAGLLERRGDTFIARCPAEVHATYTTLGCAYVPDSFIDEYALRIATNDPRAGWLLRASDGTVQHAREALEACGSKLVLNPFPATGGD